MKKKLYFLAIIMCILGGFNLSNINAQTTVLIGDDNCDNNGYNPPVDVYENYFLSQQIFPASSIGIPSGTVISKIAFKKHNGGAPTRNWSIYMMNSEAGTSFGGTNTMPVTSANKVYSGNFNIPEGNDVLVSFDLTSEFTYSGGDLILTIADNTGSGAGDMAWHHNAIGKSLMKKLDSEYTEGVYSLYSYEFTCDVYLTYEGGTPQPQTQVIEIGTQTENSSELPTNIYYNYSLTQQIYTSAEIGLNKDINITSIAFQDVSGYETTRNIEIYMRNTPDESCTTSSEKMNSDDLCWSGSVTFNANSWTTITFPTPFEYEAGKNVMLCVVDKTGSYLNYRKFAVYNTTDNSYSFYAYNDQNPYNVELNTYSNQSTPQKNCIKLEYTEAPPKPLSLSVSADKETAYTGETVQLTATASGGAGTYTYSWSPATGLNNTTSATPTFTPTTQALTTSLVKLLLLQKQQQIMLL